MDYTTEQLKKILAEHAKWFADNSEGQRADLRSVNLSYADLRSVNLSGADLSYADLRSVNLGGADLSYADLRSVNLGGADLGGADLSYADLRSVNLDYSSGIPLWCGGSKFKCDAKLIQQVLAHLCTLDCKDKQWVALRKAIRPFANKSHRAVDLGLIKQKKG